jgi:hypothetical protein
MPRSDTVHEFWHATGEPTAPGTASLADFGNEDVASEEAAIESGAPLAIPGQAANGEPAAAAAVAAPGAVARHADGAGSGA